LPLKIIHDLSCHSVVAQFLVVFDFYVTFFRWLMPSVWKRSW